MQMFGALIIFMTLSAACGLRCYTCEGYFCTDIATCPAGIDSCSITEINSVISKSCMISHICVHPIKCCEGDLCNGPKLVQDSAITTGSSVLLLLLSSSIITLFL